MCILNPYTNTLLVSWIYKYFKSNNMSSDNNVCVCMYVYEEC